MIKQKHVDAAREARLWVGQVIVPVVVAGAAVLSNTDIPQKIADKGKIVKREIEKKFKKDDPKQRAYTEEERKKIFEMYNTAERLNRQLDELKK